MSSLLSSNNLVNGLYKNNLLNNAQLKKFYHVLNFNNSKKNNLKFSCYDTISNALSYNKNGKLSNMLIQSSLLSSDESGKTNVKNQGKINAKSPSMKKPDIKNGSDTLAHRQQQQLNQIRHQIQQQQYMQKPTPRYDNSVKQKNPLNMSSTSTNRPLKVTLPPPPPPPSPNRYTNNQNFNQNYMYDQDVDGKTMFQQQIYNNTSFNNPREVI